MEKIRNRWTVLIAALFSSTALAAKTYIDNKHPQYPSYPTIDHVKLAKDKTDKIKRGEYLTKLGDCIACHTEKGGKAFAGGYPIKTPFGTIYTPNITPDKTNGIGGWSEKDFIKAMRHGKLPQGHYYYPAFPYIYFNTISDEDLKAIKAYLDVIPAVAQKNKENDLAFPFSWRFLQSGWRLLFFDDNGPYKNNPDKSSEWNRGKYLVDGLGHCSMCHTPSHYIFSKKWVLAAPIKSKYLTGGTVDGYFAPNITSAFLKNVTLQEITDVFKKDKLIGGGAVIGPMKDANHDSLRYLTANDIKAILIYLKSVPDKTETKKGEPVKVLTADDGKTIYENHCAYCHNGSNPQAPKLGDTKAWEPLVKQGFDVLVINSIRGINNMPPKGGCASCNDAQIKAAVKYMVRESKVKGDYSLW